MGGKGSGKVTTRKARKDRIRAGKIRAEQRYGTPASALVKVLRGDDDDPPAYTGPLESIKHYDKLLGLPVSWTDAKKREEVGGEILLNEQKRVEGELRRGKLFTREQVQEREKNHTDLIFGYLARFSELCATFAEPDKKDEAKLKARQFITAMREEVAEKVKARDA